MAGMVPVQNDSVVSVMPSWRRVSGSTHSHPGNLGWWHFSTAHREHTYCIHTLARPLNTGLCACDNRHCRHSSAHCASNFPSHNMAKPTHIYTLRHTNMQVNTFPDSHKHQHTKICWVIYERTTGHVIETWDLLSKITKLKSLVLNKLNKLTKTFSLQKGIKLTIHLALHTFLLIKCPLKC